MPYRQTKRSKPVYVGNLDVRVALGDKRKAFEWSELAYGHTFLTSSQNANVGKERLNLLMSMTKGRAVIGTAHVYRNH